MALLTRRLAFVCCSALLAGAAGATTFARLDDAELVDGASVVVSGRVLAVEPAPGTAPAIDYLIEIERLAKGLLPGSALVVRVPGGVRPDGVGLKILGAPQLREGEEAIFFLEPRRDGTFGPSQLMLGVFHVEPRAGRRVAYRRLEEAYELPRPDGFVPQDGLRDPAAFLGWLTDRAEGRARSKDYFLPELPTAKDGPAPDFTSLISSTQPVPLGCGPTGGHRIRWFNFEDGAGEPWYRHASGQPGLAGGGTDELRAAIEAWNADPDTPIGYRYGGTTTDNEGLTSADGSSTLLFDDPNDEIPGSFTGGGVLALGGPWFTCNLREHLGEQFHITIEGDIITQDGLGLFFQASSSPSRLAEELFSHELGHTLGLGHSGNPQALMYASARDDGRGAALLADDLAGIYSIYGGGVVLPVPPAPADLTAVAVASSEVELTWRAAVGRSSGFRIERRTGSGDFTLVTAVAPDATDPEVNRYRDTGLAPSTTYVYRVQAQNAAGSSGYSNEAAAITFAGGVPAAPTHLRAVALSDDKVRLTWQDNAEDETGFRIDILIGEGFVEIPVGVPANTTLLNIRGLGAATVAAFRVRAVNAHGSSAASNVAEVTTFGEDSLCLVDDERLCLGGGRFEVKVRWRDQYRDGLEGTGRAVPASDASGMFWFFNSDNVELMVKVLDGGSINQHFWVFTGSLSDVEHWITVTDLVSGAVKEYYNPPGDQSGRADTLAFPASPDAPLAQSLASPAVRGFSGSPAGLEVEPITTLIEGACRVGEQSLCLLGRFRVYIHWRDPWRNLEGEAQAVTGTDSSGFFWFFTLDNFEVMIKMIDGRTLNGHFWVYAGGLSNLEYTITLLDTATGRTRVYRNPAGTIDGFSDAWAFPDP